MRAAPFAALAAAATLAACGAPTAPSPLPRPIEKTPSVPRHAVAAIPAPVAPALRLPGDVKPTRYDLELTIVPDQPVVAGRIHIPAVVGSPTRVVWLNATELTILHAELGGMPAQIIPGNDDFVGFTTGHPLPPGPLTIDIAFQAKIDPGRSRGIYSEREADDTYVYTFFEAIDARRAFPCFDEPSYKVPWKLTFHVRHDHVALANAPVERETAEPGGMKKVEIATTRPLPSYLVAFVVGPFEVVDGGSAGRLPTPIRFVVPRGRTGELGYARQVTPKVVAALEDYFDMPYPYGKLDVAVVPRYWGTMEHPGLVAMGQPLTLIRPDQATRSRKHSYANILAHELSHYWFGDLVTMAWWDDTWLNEALGQWSDLNITEAAEPTWRVRDERIWMSASAMNADETLSTRAIRQPVTTKEGIAASFDNQITYAKGASMFRMFESYVGRDAWQRFIRSYLTAHAWGNASADMFLAHLAGELGPAVAASVRTFLEQPGVPRIAAQLRCQTGQLPRIELSQQRSLPAGVTDPSPKRWTVPVCLRYGDARSSFRQCVELGAERATFELAPPGRAAAPGAPPSCPTWMILNADAVGYYRSAVDPATVRALLTPGSAIAKAARPTPSERMMLIEDLRAAVERDELGFDKLLELVPVIASDADDKVALHALSAASLPMTGLDDAMYRAARRWVHQAFRARARQLGWPRRAGDSDEHHELRRAFVPLVAADDPELTRQAEALADRWLAERTGLADDLVWSALATAARHGDAARFERYLTAAKHARDRREQQRLLSSLGAFTDPAIANQALALILGRDLDLRDSIGILYGVLGRRETRDLGLSFLSAHLDELLARMRDDEAAGMLGGVSGAFCDPERRAKIAALVQPRATKIDGAQARVSRGLELADQCIALVQRQLPALRRVLGTR